MFLSRIFSKNLFQQFQSRFKTMDVANDDAFTSGKIQNSFVSLEQKAPKFIPI